jgi:hypothetical protein
LRNCNLFGRLKISNKQLNTSRCHELIFQLKVRLLNYIGLRTNIADYQTIEAYVNM